MVDQTVELTIVIPSWNGKARLPGLFTALSKQQDVTAAWEVLLVDNNSSDGTAEWVASVGGNLENGVPLRLLREPQQGPAWARQCGVNGAAGKWIAFLDDDIRPAPDWVSQLLEFTKSRMSVTAFNGRIHGRFEVTPPQGFERIESFFALFDHGDQARRYDVARMDLPPGAGLVVNRDAWQRFVPRKLRLATGPGDDHEALRHLHANQQEIWYHPGLKLEHIIPAERLKHSYLDAMMRECGDCVCWLRLVGRSPAWYPYVIAELIAGSLWRYVTLLFGGWRRKDVVRKLQMQFWLHAALSPLNLLGGPDKVPLRTRLWQ